MKWALIRSIAEGFLADSRVLVFRVRGVQVCKMADDVAVIDGETFSYREAVRVLAN